MIAILLCVVLTAAAGCTWFDTTPIDASQDTVQDGTEDAIEPEADGQDPPQDPPGDEGVPDADAEGESTGPTVPTGLSAIAFSHAKIDLAWSASTDDVSVLGYTIYRNGESVGVTSETTYRDAGLQPSTAYTYRVSAFDDDDNHSDLSDPAETVTLSVDVQYVVLKAAVRPVIDGSAGDFGSVNRITIATSSGETTALCGALWDERGLYWTCRVTDSWLEAVTTERDGRVWEDDSVELFIDLENDGGGDENPDQAYMLPDDFQFIVSVLDVIRDARGTESGIDDGSWNTDITTAIDAVGSINDEATEDEGYTMEAEITWAALGLSSGPAEGTIMGMAFAMNDRDLGDHVELFWPGPHDIAFPNASNWTDALLSPETVP